MEALRIMAAIRGPVVLGAEGYLHLDALLASAVALRDHLPPIDFEPVAIEIPVEREPGGRFHLASASLSAVERRERKHLHKRFPIAEVQRLAPQVRTVKMTAGPQKNYRIPYEAQQIEHDLLTWFCVGAQAEIRDLLGLIHGLGKKRSVGHGQIQAWNVESVADPWPGFPVLGRDGAALRHLPLDWPGLGAHRRRYGQLTYPYWDARAEQEIAAPVVSPC